MTERDPVLIDPEKLAQDHADPVDDLDGAEQVVGIFDEQLSEAERVALGIDRIVPTDDVIVPPPDLDAEI